jgi:hypothetical protein
VTGSATPCTSSVSSRPSVLRAKSACQAVTEAQGKVAASADDRCAGVVTNAASGKCIDVADAIRQRNPTVKPIAASATEREVSFTPSGWRAIRYSRMVGIASSSEF